MGTRCADHVTPLYPQKLALTSPTGGGRSVGIVLVQTKATEFSFSCYKRLHNEELNDLYSSPNIVRVIKSRRMRWAGHVARMGEERGCIGSWWGNRREGDHWEDLGIDGWII